MEQDKIFELMREFRKSGIAKMSLTEGDFCISLEMPQSAQVNSYMRQPEEHLPEAAPGASEAEYIRSPIVGTYYEAPGEGMAPFVSTGMSVKKGENVCIVEAMKMLNEIKAPFDCIIDEIMKENESPVGYEEPVFRIRRI